MTTIAMVPAATHAPTSIVVLPRREAEEWIPRHGEVCISIANPRQSDAALKPGYADVLRLGFHDTDRNGGGFTPMSSAHASLVLRIARENCNRPFMVHCQAGASRSVAIALFLAAWLNKPLEIVASDVLVANPWVINQLRGAAMHMALSHLSGRLFQCALFGSQSWLGKRAPSVRVGAELRPLNHFT